MPLKLLGGLLIAPPCTTGIGCVGAGFLVFNGADNAASGLQTALSGKPTSTLGGEALQLAGFSPETAELLYGMTSLAPSAFDAIRLSRAIDTEAAVSAWIRGTYTGDSYEEFAGSIFRYTLPEYAEGTWKIYPGNVSSNHRYSEPGIGAVYAGTTADTAAAEVASYAALEGKMLVSRGVVIRNVLDLTDPVALKALGITKEQLTNGAHGGNSYEITQRISAWARSQGYEAILAPSAQKPDGVNLISFHDLDKKGGGP